jgi:hypothetical protein
LEVAAHKAEKDIEIEKLKEQLRKSNSNKEE